MKYNWLYGTAVASILLPAGCGQRATTLSSTASSAPSFTPTTALHRETVIPVVEALGMVGYDTRLISTISARVSGRIEKLYVRYRYQHVHAGQHIMDLYSPELATPEQELLFLLRNDPTNSALIEAARQRLLLLGVSREQLADIQRTGRASATLGVYSNYTGHIHEAGNTMPAADPSPEISTMTQELPVKEGMYVEKGQPVFQVFNTNRGWVLLKLFPGDAALVRKGDTVRVVPETAPDHAFPARVDEVLPLYGKEDKTLTVRVYFDNSQKDIPIGSQVKATIYPSAITGNWLPGAAVISLGTARVAFLRVKEGFRAHKVITGTVYKDQVQVLSGLAPEDSVAQNAGFLVDSEDFTAALLLAASPGKKEAAVAPTAVHSDTMYTCSMHPQVMQDRPGKCPICGMELVPEKMSADAGDGSVRLSDQQVQLGGIRVDTVGNGALGDRMVLTGTVTVDETGSSAVSARLAGRIHRLYVKTTGESVHKGQKLYDLYSEELNNAEQEYLLALERQETLHSNVVDLKQLADAAKGKLLLWGLSQGQVDDLARTRKPQGLTSFDSPAEGVVASVESHEGDYVAAGTVVVRLTDLSSVWVEAQVYTSQLSELDRKATVVVRLPDMPGRQWMGKIAFIDPEVDPTARINRVRVALRNTDGVLKPGMAAEVTVTNDKHHSLTLPQTAVIRSANGSLVWVVAGHNRFRPVMVETGVEDGGRVEIRSGLTAGDVVVSEGAYLVNSEYEFKHGGNAMAGMKM